MRRLAANARVMAALALLLVAAVPAARADDSYPTRPIRLLVGFGAGGPTDIPARFIADKLGSALGQPVVVENKPGAGGMVATRDVIAQPADGYTLLLCTHFEAINIAVYRNAGFKLADLAPVSLIAKYYYALALSNAVPAADFKSFIAYAKAHPGDVTYATVGSGSAQEIIARELEQVTGVTMNRIPFRGGIQVVQELLAGRIGFYISPTLAILPQYQSKQLKILAMTSPERVESLPEIPDAQGIRNQFRPFRVARRMRPRGHAGGDHQDAARSHCADRRRRGLSRAGRYRRHHCGFVDAGRTRRDHEQDARRYRSERQRIRHAAGPVNC